MLVMLSCRYRDDCGGDDDDDDDVEIYDDWYDTPVDDIGRQWTWAVAFIPLAHPYRAAT